MRVRSEGMNIRNNAGKITRLGSRRRPVSVDGDIAYSGCISDQKSSEPSVSTDLSPHNELLVVDPHNGGDHGKADMFTNSPAQSGRVHFTVIMTPVSAYTHYSNGFIQVLVFIEDLLRMWLIRFSLL